MPSSASSSPDREVWRTTPVIGGNPPKAADRGLATPSTIRNVITPMMCEDVRQVYPTEDGEGEALAGVSKEFAPGAITAIAGPSGSGKSTLLRILACITRPERGRVRVEDLDVVRLSGRRRRRLRRYRLAYLFQNPADNLIEYLTAAQ